MFKKISILFLVSLMVLSLSGCGKEKPSNVNLGNAEQEVVDGAEEDEMILVSKNQVEKVNEQANELSKQIKTLETDLNKKEEEVEFHRSYVQKVLKSFTPEQLQSVIDLEWEYSLSINNVDFPTSGVLEIKENNFSLVLSEKRVDYSVLSQSDSTKGKYPGSLPGILSIPSNYKAEREEKNISDIHSLVSYKFADLKSGDTIDIKVNNGFKEMMGFETDILKIVVK